MKIAIAGYGLEGESNYRYYAAHNADITIFDAKEISAEKLPKDVKTQFGADVFSKLEGFDIVVRTAGLPPRKIKTDGKVWSATQEFFAQCPAPIIGVTGTKGKGTTASLITSILREAGNTAHLIGNIGQPALDVLPKVASEDIVVYEMSSFQLWDMERSPHVAVVLMIEPEHQDVHESMDDYVMAKANIARWQKPVDACVFNPNNEYSRKIASMSPGRQIPYMEKPGCEVKDGYFYIAKKKICKVEVLQLPGKHNYENACAAISAAWQFTHDTQAIEKGLSGFQGLEHRLEFVREYKGARYYNDSFSSAPGAAIAALNAFEEPKIIILGGHNRGLSFMELASVVKQSGVKKAVLIGQTAQKIANALDSVGFSSYELMSTKNLSAIVDSAVSSAAPGDVVLLSPACASFDMFTDFYERGNQFKQLVNNLADDPSPRQKTFIFENYSYDQQTGEAKFSYKFSDGPSFTERVKLRPSKIQHKKVLDSTLFLAFGVIGTSYFKAFPTQHIKFANHTINEWQANFLNKVYQEGLSQFAYENGLTRGDLAVFRATQNNNDETPEDYQCDGAYVLQSGGKDSLLLAQMLTNKKYMFDTLYLSSSPTHPSVIDKIGAPLTQLQRALDVPALKQAVATGGKNGHVPVTYIVLALALVQAVIDGKQSVLAAIGHEGEEPHAHIGDLSITHQWSKTWDAEQLFAQYVARFISPNIKVGSPLRALSELRIAELFSKLAWSKYGHSFSSCNIANYGQGKDNSQLAWCGNCPKCANSFLLFAPFIEPSELQALFGGQNLFNKQSLHETWQGLFGLEGKLKPFECVGETAELRLAYHMARDRWGVDTYTLPFDVPVSDYDYMQKYPAAELGLDIF